MTNHQIIIDFIIAAVELERIFLIKNLDLEGYTTNSCTELLLIIPSSTKVPVEKFETVLKIISVKHQQVMLSLHRSDHVEAALKNGHQFYSIHCIEENMVFSNSRTRLTLTAPETLLELKTKTCDHFYATMLLASDFLSATERNIEMGSLKMTAIMLHQAAEQIYKAISFSLGSYIQKTHKLVKLAKIAERYASIIGNIFEDDTLLNLLDHAYSLQPNPYFEINEAEIIDSHTRIKSLHRLSLLLFETRLKSYPQFY